MRVPSLVPMLLCGAAILEVPLAGQCGSSWLPGDGIAGVATAAANQGDLRELMTWDRDGTGPLPPVLVLGGAFQLAGTLVTRNVVAFDPSAGAWQQLGTGVDGVVNCAVVLPNGDLLVGGGFAEAGGQAAAGLARWDGVAWSGFGGGAVGEVFAIVVMPNGDVVAGGSFSSIGGSPIAGLARWTARRGRPPVCCPRQAPPCGRSACCRTAT